MTSGRILSVTVNDKTHKIAEDSKVCWAETEKQRLKRQARNKRKRQAKITYRHDTSKPKAKPVRVYEWRYRLGWTDDSEEYFVIDTKPNVNGEENRVIRRYSDLIDAMRFIKAGNNKRVTVRRPRGVHPVVYRRGRPAPSKYPYNPLITKRAKR